jgi:holo-[acyl-carrier protein] synthase
MIFGVGTDIVEISRIEEVGLERLAERILTVAERRAMPSQPERQREYVAGRFAAKEAISKALGTGIGEMLRFMDIEIMPDELGAPRVALSRSVLQQFFGRSKVKIHVSISHSREYAVATAVIEEGR